MANPVIHAKSSVKKWGGTLENYLPIHKAMDGSKSACASNQHRVVWHSSYGACVLVPMVFGDYITNSDGKQVSTKDIAEQHILEDFRMKFIPTLQDYIDHMENPLWMNNAMGDDVPNSVKNMRRPKDVAGEESFELGPVVGKD